MWTGLTLRHAPPRRPASYGRVEVLDHHALVAGGDGAFEEALGLVGVGGDDRREAAVIGHGCGEDLASRRQRLVDEAGAGVEDVEEERLQAVAAPGTDARRVGAEVAHRVLEASRGAGVVDAEHLAVEHEIAARQGAHDLDDAAQSIGDVVEVAGVEPNVAGRAVGLDPRAVELPLDRGEPGFGERVGDAGGR